MDSGSADHDVAFGTKEPNYVMDEVTGRVYLLGKDAKVLTALSVK